MRVTLVTVGSRGDVEPFVALALALADRGAEIFSKRGGQRFFVAGRDGEGGEQAATR